MMKASVIVASDVESQVYPALIDADFWGASSTGGMPADFGGFLLLTGEQREVLADADRLVLRLQGSDELYRMILDGGNGRFVARRL